MSTRLIGGIIMVHGDDNGLVLPPRIAPVQVMIVPIQQAKEGVLEKAAEIKSVLSGYRVKVDDTDKSPMEICRVRDARHTGSRGDRPKDIEAGQAILVRRDTHEKISVSLEEIGQKGRTA